MPRLKNIIAEYKNYHLPMHFPVLLFSGDYCKISDTRSNRLHFHNCLEIGVCHSDSGTLEIYGSSLSFKAGDITVIPKNVPHTTYSTAGTESHWSYIYLDTRELFRNILPVSWRNFELNQEGFSGYKYILNRKDYPHVHHLVMSVIRELEEQRPSYQISARGLLTSLYIELYRIQSTKTGNGYVDSQAPFSTTVAPDNPLVIAPVLDYIDQNYMQQFTIDYLAELCHWSPTHFRRVFHDIMGTSPLDYVNSTRISKACNLLRNTETSILDISEMVGFHSVSSFNRYFIKIMQMSPREYRKQMQQSDRRAEYQSSMDYTGWNFSE